MAKGDSQRGAGEAEPDALVGLSTTQTPSARLGGNRTDPCPLQPPRVGTICWPQGAPHNAPWAAAQCRVLARSLPRLHLCPWISPGHPRLLPLQPCSLPGKKDWRRVCVTVVATALGVAMQPQYYSTHPKPRPGGSQLWPCSQRSRDPFPRILNGATSPCIWCHQDSAACNPNPPTAGTTEGTGLP